MVQCALAAVRTLYIVLMLGLVLLVLRSFVGL
jgi:hypothetical protein